MIPTVAPVDVSISAPAAAPQNAAADLEIASGPSRSPSAVEAFRFGDLLRAKDSPQAELQARPTRPQAASRIGSAVDGAMRHLSALETQAHSMVFGADGAIRTSSAPAAGGVGQVGFEDAPGGAVEPGSDRPSAMDLIKQAHDVSQQEARSTMMLVQFELQSTLYGKAAEKSLGAINQLIQEK